PAAGTAEPSEDVEDAVLMALLCAGEEVADGPAGVDTRADGPAAAVRAGQRPGTIETLTEEPAESATASSAFWKSARPNWWVQMSSRGRVPFSMILIAPGQVCGPRWAPRTSSSLSSEMIDQSTETFSLNTEYSTKRPSLRSRFRPCGTALGWPVHSMYTSAPYPPVRSRISCWTSTCERLWVRSAPHFSASASLSSSKSSTTSSFGLLCAAPIVAPRPTGPAPAITTTSSKRISARSTACSAQDSGSAYAAC